MAFPRKKVARALLWGAIFGTAMSVARLVIDLLVDGVMPEDDGDDTT